MSPSFFDYDRREDPLKEVSRREAYWRELWWLVVLVVMLLVATTLFRNTLAWPAFAAEPTTNEGYCLDMRYQKSDQIKAYCAELLAIHTTPH